MDARTQALAEIVATARAHRLSAREIAAALGDSRRDAGDNRARTVLVRVLGYLGGTFVFAGICVFIALQWSSLGSAARVIVTLGSGLSVFVLAVLSSGDVRFEQATPPLFLVAGVLEPTGMMVAFKEYGSGGDWRWAALATSGAVALQFLATFTRIRQATVVFLSVAFATMFFGTALDLLDVDGKVVGLVLGAALLLTAVGLDRTTFGAVTPTLYLAGAALFLIGLFESLRHTPFEPLFLAAAAGLVYVSVLVHSRTVLFAGTVAILAYTGWFTGEYFADSVGWPLALIVLGLLMIALSALAFRIDRRYVRPR